MSNEVAIREPRPSLTTGHRPMAIVPTSMDEAYRLGKALVISGMAPNGVDTPEKAMIAIMRGMEIGLTPMQAVDKIAVVNGRPTIWGDGAMGLVRGSGLCEYVKESISGDGDTRTATCIAKRKGEDEPITRTFSVSNAKTANLWGKAGPWKQFPDRMLQMRARAFALRDLFADVLGGLYLREEIEDDGRRGRREEAPTPPADVLQVTYRKDEPSAGAKGGGEGSQASEVITTEDAEIVGESTSSSSGGGASAHHPSEGASAPTPEPQEQDEETFDVEEFFKEAADAFSFCRTAENVDETHEAFSERVEANLSRADRERYGEIHQKALERFKESPQVDKEVSTAPGLIDDDDDGFPAADALKEMQAKPKTPGEEYADRIRDRLRTAGETPDSLITLWNDGKTERKILKAQGHLTDEDRDALKNEVLARIGELKAGTAPQPPQDEQAPPPPSEAEGDAPKDEKAAFEAEFRKRVAEIATVTELNDYSSHVATTRNRLGEGDRPWNDALKSLVVQKRNLLNGI